MNLISYCVPFQNKKRMTKLSRFFINKKQHLDVALPGPKLWIKKTISCKKLSWDFPKRVKMSEVWSPMAESFYFDSNSLDLNRGSHGSGNSSGYPWYSKFVWIFFKLPTENEWNSTKFRKAWKCTCISSSVRIPTSVYMFSSFFSLSLGNLNNDYLSDISLTCIILFMQHFNTWVLVFLWK